MTNSKEISKELLKDPNFIAYQKAEAEGLFKDLEPGTYVAFVHGLLVGTATTFQELDDLRISGNRLFFHQVNIPEEIIDIPTFEIEEGSDIIPPSPPVSGSI